MIRDLCDRASLWARAIGLLLVAAAMSLTGAAAETTARTDQSSALKIGFLLDLSSGSAEVYRDRQRAGWTVPRSATGCARWAARRTPS